MKRVARIKKEDHGYYVEIQIFSRNYKGGKREIRGRYESRRSIAGELVDQGFEGDNDKEGIFINAKRERGALVGGELLSEDSEWFFEED